MAQYAVDSLIKALRKSKKMTQKELCEGVCTQDTLSRIERGERMPDWYTFEKLMDKLGEDPYKYYTSVITSDEKFILEKKREIGLLVSRDLHSEAERLLIAIENTPPFQLPDNRQFVLHARSTFLRRLHNDFKGSYELALQAIRITRPNFEIEKLDEYVLTHYEILLVNTMATALAEVTDIDDIYELTEVQRVSAKRAIGIWQSLVTKIKNDCAFSFDILDTRLNITSAISASLRMLHRFDECVDLCDEGIESAKEIKETHLTTGFLREKGYSLLLDGKQEDGLKALEQRYHLLLGLDRRGEWMITERVVRERLGICLNF